MMQLPCGMGLHALVSDNGGVPSSQCPPMAQSIMREHTTTKPPRLQPGDRVRFVSPASTPDTEDVVVGARMLESWGLRVEFGAHCFDRWGHYLAGNDEDRLADFNNA